MPREHVSRKFENDLQTLRSKILSLGEMVANAIAQACISLETWEEGPALATIEGDQQINSLEVDIDESCLTMIALYQPAATDLRFITTAMKIITTLERIGDLAGNISRYALDLIAAMENSIDLTPQLSMAVKVQELLENSLRAFINWDAELALQTARRDQAIDRIYQDSLWEAVKRMQGRDLQSMHNIMRTFMISKFLERIGDHAVHICEMVVFMVKGRIIRHQKATLDYLDEEFH
ncbi:phosphate signaling complex protein PhoU [Desulfobacca acetoxidans]|uniref:Phosphate-specific transport system accessory protein PhoU n=1 Tax=Desulfobacca acetoxidans (strain ATCC 700848 / DSM 11109 / ASRB2) TaxID=880072 RepID=F2NDV3_DESAR|nr:phosphate signaling complex protein PhoU [Desulfobacca acetoxidans]AEB10450.1 phosphate uptake regulator, PhoU [Desulfobacca acetoxidans DSM 11109]